MNHETWELSSAQATSLFRPPRYHTNRLEYNTEPYATLLKAKADRHTDKLVAVEVDEMALNPNRPILIIDKVYTWPESDESGSTSDAAADQQFEQCQDSDYVDGTSGQSSESDDLAKPNKKPEWEELASNLYHSLLSRTLSRRKIRHLFNKGHRTKPVNLKLDSHSYQMEIAYRKGRELIRMLTSEVDFCETVTGHDHWNAPKLVKAVNSFKYTSLDTCRYKRPKIADIVLYLDISPSCEEQAQMFLAIAAGALRDEGVRAFVGFNGSVYMSEVDIPTRATRYENVKPVLAEKMRYLSEEVYYGGRIIKVETFSKFLSKIRPKTVIVFGDWDGLDQYTILTKKTSVRAFWFCNNHDSNATAPIPKGWTKKNYISGLYVPYDMVKALRKLRSKI